MKARTFISVSLVVLAALAVVFILAGCGDDKQTTTAAKISCDPNAPSIIPEPQGRPQLVEFFRDT